MHKYRKINSAQRERSSGMHTKLDSDDRSGLPCSL